jgi:glycosyltransferase involved in cell wall biosynthesis
MKKIISILHHPLPQTDRKLAEESGLGWHFRSAKALMKYGDFLTIATRPNISAEWRFKVVDGVVLVLAPSLNLSPSRKVWKWSYVSPSLASLVGHFVRYDYVPYIHEYRALNSEIILRRVGGCDVILQHHGSFPPVKGIFSDPIKVLKELNKLRRELYLKKVRGVFFVLNRREEFYLKEILNVDTDVKIRTMAVDFNELKPLSEIERSKVKENLGIEDDEVLLVTYVGIFGEEFSGIKGAHFIVKIWRELKKRLSRRVKIVVTGIGESYLPLFRRLGILAYKLLTHKDFTKIVGASDAYFLPATPGYMYGGSGAVAIMEALAMGIPVVSPTLRDFPEPDHIKDLGIATEYISNENTLKEFINALIYVNENRKRYKPWVIRELSHKYYSWESFVRDFNNAVKKL